MPSSLPKSSAEILAAAKKPQNRPRKPKSDFRQIFKDRISTFTAQPSTDTLHATDPTSFSRSEPAPNVHQTSTIRFNNPITSQSLEAALEIKEPRDVEDSGCYHDEELFDDERPSPLDNWASASEPESPVDSISSSQTGRSFSECILDALAVLRSRRLSPFDLVLEILDEVNPQYSYHRAEFYKDGNQKLFRILDVILASNAGKRKIKTWIQQSAILDSVCDVITDEMNIVQKAEQLPGIAAITPEFINNWTVSACPELAPCLSRILSVAAQTATAEEKNKKKHPDMLCNILLKQLSYQRSTFSLGFPTIFGLFLWVTGSARQAIDAIHRCGLSVSYPSILNALSSLSNRCVELAGEIGRGVHVFCYDNVNLSTSIFVEQRGASTPAKVTSGTFAVLYEVRNGNPEHMKLAPIMERFKQVKGLDFNYDLEPTVQQRVSFQSQLKVVIVRVLTKYIKGFETHSDEQSLQHKPRRPIPKGYITKQFPLRATTIDEATVRGNLLFHDDIYMTQLNRSVEELSEYAIPSINDQLTNSRIRSGQILRARDDTPWERREVFQLGFGLFHLCLNMVWALLHVHRGTLGNIGSLTYYFALLQKTRLGSEHPDYHTLLSALMQIFDGLILNAWRTECGHKTFSEFAKSGPSPADLLKIAGTIVQKYATPMDEVEKDTAESSGDDNSADEANVSKFSGRTRQKPVPPIMVDDALDPDDDKVHQNSRLLTRDLLYLSELVRAISDGDIGRIEDFLPQLAKMFRGAGSNNYCTEILHFILNLKYVWTPQFADIMQDNMLVNISGLEGHAMAIDINMEHLIGKLKDLLTAKGLESTWDRLGDISAAIDYLSKIKKKTSKTLGASYQGSTHTTPDTSHLVWRVADNVRDNEIQVFKEDRPGNKVKGVVNILATGEAKLRSSSLATFNRKMFDMVNGRTYEEEEDPIPRPQLTIAFEEIEC